MCELSGNEIPFASFRFRPKYKEKINLRDGAQTVFTFMILLVITRTREPE